MVTRLACSCAQFEESVLSFSGVCALFALPSAAMVPISWYLIDEPRVAPEASGSAPQAAVAEGKKQHVEAAAEAAAAEAAPISMRAYWAAAWALLRSGALFEVLLWLFWTQAIGGIATTAGAEIQIYWARPARPTDTRGCCVSKAALHAAARMHRTLMPSLAGICTMR